MRVGATVVKPTPIFTKLDESVVEEELARLERATTDPSSDRSTDRCAPSRAGRRAGRSGRAVPDAPDPLPIPVVDNHTHLDIARDGEDAPDVGAAIAAAAAVGVDRARPDRLRPAGGAVHGRDGRPSPGDARWRGPAPQRGAQARRGRRASTRHTREIEELAAHPRVRVDRRDGSRLLPHRA